MNKYLFLDIDGVLNHDEWYSTNECKKLGSNWKKSSFDPICVERVNKILEKTGAKLVISSSWRSMSDLDKIFDSVGLPTDFYVTPYASIIYGLDPLRIHEDNKLSWRGSEIKYWLNKHDPKANYAIIDDDADMLEDQLNNFVQTCGDKIYSPDLYFINEGSGLTEKVMNKVIEILNK